MKMKIAILAVLGLILGLVAYGYSQAIPPSQSQTESQPQIEITPITFDFGEVKYGEIAEYTFKIKNLGKEVLEIKRVSTSCGCTTAEVSKKRIESNEEVDLKVVYDTGAMSGSHAKGKQERTIYVKSNDQVDPQVEVIINAYVK